MRMHLATHSKDELKPFGLNPVLLKQDIILHEQRGHLLQCSELAEEAVTSIDMHVVKNISFSHCRIYYKMKNALFRTNPQDQDGSYSEVSSSKLPHTRSENVMETLGGMGDRSSHTSIEGI
jgi:hypothetical protein